MVDQLNPAKNGVSRTANLSETVMKTPIRSISPRSKKAQLPGFAVGKRFRRLSLKTKATAIAIAIGTIPVLVTGSIAYSIANQSITQQIIQTEENLAQTLSRKLVDFMEERYGDMQVLSSLPALTHEGDEHNITDEDRKKILESYVGSYSVYESIAVFDLNGNAMVKSDQRDIPNQAEQFYFKSALASDKIQISRPTQVAAMGPFVIYLTAPVKESATGRRVGILRAVLPVKAISERLKDYDQQRLEYSVIDSSNQIFLSSREELAGSPAPLVYDEFAQMQSRLTINSRVMTKTEKSGKYSILANYVPWTGQANLPDLKWDVMLSTPTELGFLPQRQLFWTFVSGTGAAIVLTGLLAAWLANRATRPILAATSAVKDLGSGRLDTRIEVAAEDEVGLLGSNINQMAGQLQTLLQQQMNTADRSQLLSQIIVKIRRSLKFDDILQTGVDEIREFINTDRVVIYRFAPDYKSGTITAESTATGVIQARGKILDDPLEPNLVDRYRSGRVWSMEDLEQAELTHCHCDILKRLQVRANIVAPIMRNHELIGLICTHQCSGPRRWTPEEIDLFAQLATQIGYALDQAYVLEQAEEARAIAEELSEERRRQKEELQLQLINLLSEVEGAVMGDLTVRADVTAGDIGTVADFFNSIVESLRQIVTQVKDAALQVNAALGDDEQAVRQLSSEAVKQAEETSRTLNSVEIMVRSIQSVATSAQQTANVAQEASATAEKGGLAMDLTVQNILGLRETIGETAKKVKRLGESSQQISKVVSLINQIAVQTNLLAINAGIEAARAGEDSQGFAIVAEEVGELATRSATATREIEQIVANIQRETTEVVDAMEQGTSQVVEGTRLVENAKHSLEQILRVSRHINELVGSISNATVSQVETSEAVMHLMHEIVRSAERTSDSSLTVSESLRQTVEVARELQESVGAFKVS
jgi:twitching motility protein PilJ